MNAPAPAISKRCPECGRALVERVNRQNGSHFLGCVGWPEACQHTEPLPEYLRLIARGATQLPGLEDL